MRSSLYGSSAGVYMGCVPRTRCMRTSIWFNMHTYKACT